MTGLYFYKLVSPYEDDVTKDCKLTVNEIDHNFITLKDADINDATYDELSNKITLTRNNGDTMELDISSIVDGMTTNLEVSYDSICGTITITYNDKKAVIDGLITKDNLSKEILTEVITDSTLKGNGTCGDPLGLSLVEETGTYRPAKRFIDLAKGEFLPSPECLSIGDRFVTYESANEYGYLYNFHAVERLNADLKHGWRVPTKEDWDNMLNAIEPCDAYKTHNSQMANTVLGKVAGKLLKSKKYWSNPISSGCSCDCASCPCQCDAYLNYTDDETFDVAEDIKTEVKKKKIDPKGVDLFGMGIVPAGYGDGCQVMEYFNKRGVYWTSTKTNSLDVYTKRFDFDKAGVIQDLDTPSSLFSIRLVKDYDGKNFHQVESINGQDYPCALMPSDNSEHGFAIWTAMNLSLSQNKYNPVTPNGGENIACGAKHAYFIYVWTGKDFVKKEMADGESVVLQRGLADEYNGEYRLMNGKLVNVSDTVYEDVMDKVQPQIDAINEHLDTIDDEICEINDEISGLTEDIDELYKELDEEIEERKEAISAVTEELREEEEKRAQDDADLWDGLDREISARTRERDEIWSAIDSEVESRKRENKELWEALGKEEEKRASDDQEIWSAIDAEVSARTRERDEIWSAIDQEVSTRERERKELWEALDAEKEKRASDDKEIWNFANYIENHMIIQEGSKYDLLNGTLTLATKGEDTPNIIIDLDSNYGTF